MFFDCSLMGVPGASDIIRRLSWVFDETDDSFCRDGVFRSEGYMTEMEARKSDEMDQEY